MRFKKRIGVSLLTVLALCLTPTTVNAVDHDQLVHTSGKTTSKAMKVVKESPENPQHSQDFIIRPTQIWQYEYYEPHFRTMHHLFDFRVPFLDRISFQLKSFNDTEFNRFSYEVHSYWEDNKVPRTSFNLNEVVEFNYFSEAWWQHDHEYVLLIAENKLGEARYGKIELNQDNYKYHFQFDRYENPKQIDVFYEGEYEFLQYDFNWDIRNESGETVKSGNGIHIDESNLKDLPEGSYYIDGRLEAFSKFHTHLEPQHHQDYFKVVYGELKEIHEIKHSDGTITQITEEVTRKPYETPYSTKPLEKEGYKLVETLGNATGIYKEGSQEVRYIYELIKTNVTSKYVTEDGEELHVPIIEEGEFGEEYSTETKEFEGYELIELPINSAGTHGEYDIEVVFVYRAITPPVDPDPDPDPDPKPDPIKPGGGNEEGNLSGNSGEGVLKPNRPTSDSNSNTQVMSPNKNNNGSSENIADTKEKNEQKLPKTGIKLEFIPLLLGVVLFFVGILFFRKKGLKTND